VANLEELKKQSTSDLQKAYEEKINGLSQLQEQKQALYEQQITDLEKKSSINWITVIIAVVLGLIIGYLIKGH